MLQRRRHFRVTLSNVGIHRTGQIIPENDSRVLDCTIHDLSGGACLQVTSADRIPERFHLIVHPDSEKRFCTVAWREDKRVGVKFQVARTF